MRSLRRLLGPVLLLALLGLLAVGLTRPRTTTGDTALAGQPAPDFALKTLDGGTVSLAQLRGRPVMVNFWASWCAPCRDEAPMLNAAARDGAKDGLVVLGVAYKDDPKDSRAFRDEFRLGFPVLLDPSNATSVHYGLAGVPETFFVGRDGKIVARHAGPLTAEALERQLRRVLE